MSPSKPLVSTEYGWEPRESAANSPKQVKHPKNDGLSIFSLSGPEAGRALLVLGHPAMTEGAPPIRPI